MATRKVENFRFDRPTRAIRHISRLMAHRMHAHARASHVRAHTHARTRGRQGASHAGDRTQASTSHTRTRTRAYGARTRGVHVPMAHDAQIFNESTCLWDEDVLR